MKHLIVVGCLYFVLVIYWTFNSSLLIKVSEERLASSCHGCATYVVVYNLVWLVQKIEYKFSQKQTRIAKLSAKIDFGYLYGLPLSALEVKFWLRGAIQIYVYL